MVCSCAEIRHVVLIVFVCFKVSQATLLIRLSHCAP